MQHANTQLVPLFPYYGPGAIVYSGALFRGGPGYDVGHFFHYNTVDEISFVWGAHGALLETGRIMAQPNLHGVNSFLRDPESPDSFLLVTIVQRQSDTEAQTEKLIWRCMKCHEHLFVHEFTDRPTDDHEDRFPEFPTLNQSVEPVARFNSDESLRTCIEMWSRQPAVPDGRVGMGEVVDASAHGERRARGDARNGRRVALDRLTDGAHSQEAGAGVRRGEGVRAVRRDARARRWP